jgi:hypothetical protein
MKPKCERRGKFGDAHTRVLLYSNTQAIDIFGIKLQYVRITVQKYIVRKT